MGEAEQTNASLSFEGPSPQFLTRNVLFVPLLPCPGFFCLCSAHQPAAAALGLSPPRTPSCQISRSQRVAMEGGAGWGGKTRPSGNAPLSPPLSLSTVSIPPANKTGTGVNFHPTSPRPRHNVIASPCLCHSAGEKKGGAGEEASARHCGRCGSKGYARVNYGKSGFSSF